jgi:hypothetical protein
MQGHLQAALLAFVLVAASSEQAFAQPRGYVERKTAEGQTVSFDDDPLGAVTGEPIGLQLSGFRPPRRCDLMRPRVNFVPELLKTVEKM